MGLPIERLIVATNRNDILHRCLETGAYRTAGVSPTISPSMDIQVSSNFERALFDVYDRDGRAVAQLMDELKATGGFAVSQGALGRLRDIFASGRASEDETRATITRADPSRRTVEAVDARGVRLRLPADYLDAGHVAHGYAITGHKAQGLTCDHTYTLGAQTLYREWGYIALSRGRLSNQLYHGPVVDDDGAVHHHVHVDTDEVASLTSRLRRSRAEAPLADQTDTLGADIRRLEALLTRGDVQRQRDLTELRDQAAVRLRHEQNRLAALDTRLGEMPRGLRGLTQRHQRDRLLSRRRWQQHTLEQTTTRLVDLDRQLAEIKLEAEGVELDEPTDEQVEYMDSWQHGT